MLYIFDLGNVMIKNIHFIAKMSKKLGLDETALRSDYSVYDIPLMEGYMKISDYYDHLERKFSLKCEEDYFSTCFEPVDNQIMWTLARKLKTEGNRVVIGSNTFSSHWDRFSNDDAYLSLFDNLYASHLMHLVKPHPSFFREILKREGEKAENTVFIDDLKANVEGAMSIGIDGFHYTGDTELISRFGL